MKEILKPLVLTGMLATAACDGGSEKTPAKPAEEKQPEPPAIVEKAPPPEYTEAQKEVIALWRQLNQVCENTELGRISDFTGTIYDRAYANLIAHKGMPSQDVLDKSLATPEDSIKALKDAIADRCKNDVKDASNIEACKDLLPTQAENPSK